MNDPFWLTNQVFHLLMFFFAYIVGRWLLGLLIESAMARRIFGSFVILVCAYVASEIWPISALWALIILLFIWSDFLIYRVGCRIIDFFRAKPQRSV